jgi:hypothetical protein
MTGPTIGLDLGDRSNWCCMLDEAGTQQPPDGDAGGIK